jgi:DNA-binding transcriptional LysR family regulator
LVELAESLELGLRAVRRTEQELGGVVRVSTGDGFAGPLVQVLAELRRRTPETQIELVSEARLADLSRREADLAIRTSRTSSAVVVERPLGRLAFSLYGSKEYVARRLPGATLAPADLARLDFVGFVGPHEQLPQAKWLASLGAKRFGFRANTDALLHEAARQSQGLAVLADLVGDADPTLQRLEVTPRAPTIPVWLVFHRELRSLPRVRSVAQAIEAAFRARLPR